jgi:2-methylisocitrate lyase-like PEP mutase family enzyme
VKKPLMIVDLPGGTLADEERAGAALVLYYGFAAMVQYDALERALETFRRTGDANAVTGYRERIAEFEDFMGYKEYAARARKYGD